MKPGDCQWVVAGTSSCSTSASIDSIGSPAAGGEAGSAWRNAPGFVGAEHRVQLHVAEVVGRPVHHATGLAPVGLGIHVAGPGRSGSRVVSHGAGAS